MFLRRSPSIKPSCIVPAAHRPRLGQTFVERSCGERELYGACVARRRVADPINELYEDDVDGKHPISGSPFAPLLESVSKGNDVAWYGTPGADML